MKLDSASEASQSIEIDPIPILSLFSFIGLYYFRDMLEPVIVHKVTKAIEPYPSSADMRVPVDPRSEVFF